MLTRYTMAVTALLLCLAASGFGRADAASDDNAALRYWRAFAMMPALNDHTRPKIDSWDSVQLRDDTKTLLATYENAFHLAKLGSDQPRCDWGIDMSVDGPYTLLPYLPRGRELSAAMLLSARQNFAAKRGAAGVDDLIAIWTMGRHLAARGPLVSVLVQYAIESNAITCAAQNLAYLSDAEVAALSERIAALPPAATIAESMTHGERMTGWLRKVAASKTEGEFAAMLDNLLGGEQGDKSFSGKKLVEKIRGMKGLPGQIDQMDAFYAEAATIAAMPYDQFGPACDALEKKIKQSDAELVKPVMPALGKARAAEQRRQTKWKMLEAGIARRAGGEKAFDGVLDPISGQSFQVTPLPSGGFQLKSELDDGKGSPMTLDFPATTAVGAESKGAK